MMSIPPIGATSHSYNFSSVPPELAQDVSTILNSSNLNDIANALTQFSHTCLANHSESGGDIYPSFNNPHLSALFDLILFPYRSGGDQSFSYSSISDKTLPVIREELNDWISTSSGSIPTVKPIHLPMQGSEDIVSGDKELFRLISSTTPPSISNWLSDTYGTADIPPGMIYILVNSLVESFKADGSSELLQSAEAVNQLLGPRANKQKVIEAIQSDLIDNHDFQQWLNS